LLNKNLLRSFAEGYPHDILIPNNDAHDDPGRILHASGERLYAAKSTKTNFRDTNADDATTDSANVGNIHLSAGDPKQRLSQRRHP
jgi:hypothetical protein